MALPRQSKTMSKRRLQELLAATEEAAGRAQAPLTSADGVEARMIAAARRAGPGVLAAPTITTATDRLLATVRPAAHAGSTRLPHDVHATGAESSPRAGRPKRELAPRSDLWVCNGGTFEVSTPREGPPRAQCTICEWSKVWKPSDGTSSLRAHSKSHKAHLANHASNWAAPAAPPPTATADAVVQALNIIRDAVAAPDFDIAAISAAFAAAKK